MTEDLSTPLLSEEYLRLKRYRHGLILYNINDWYIGRSLDLYGESQENELALLGRIIKPGRTILDIGANIGTHTIFFAQRTGPSGRVISFEPQRALYHILCANTALNRLHNVTAFHAGAGAQPGSLAIPPIDYSKPNNFGGISFTESVSGEKVPLTTVDMLRLSRCDLMKIDVEGFEYDVLRGASRTIQRFRPPILIENRDTEQSPRLIGLLRSMGYRLHWHLPKLWNPDNFYGVTENIFGEVLCINMLCIHETSPVKVEKFLPVKGPDDHPFRDAPKNLSQPWVEEQKKPAS